MSREWNPSRSFSMAVAHLRKAKAALLDERLDRYRFDTTLVSRVADELFEIDEVMDDLKARTYDFEVELLEDQDGR